MARLGMARRGEARHGEAGEARHGEARHGKAGMNMNNFPSGFESATERRPLPKWAMWLAAALVFGGYALLEYQDAQVEIVIQQARK